MELLTRDADALIKLFDTKSITLAAEQLGLQQPALSKALMRVEDELGTPLFIRTSTGLKPTSFAERLVRELRSVSESWRQKFQDIVAGEERIEGTYRIGCHTVLASIYVIHPYLALMKKHERLNLNVSLKRSLEVAKDVAEGNLQFGVIAGPASYSDLVVHKLAQEFAAVWSRGTLKKGSRVFYNPEMVQVQSHARALKDYELIPLADYELIFQLVTESKELGAILPSKLAEKATSLKKASSTLYNTDISFIHRFDMPQTAAAKAILREFKEAAKTR